MFGLRINKSQAPEKNEYVIHDTTRISHEIRNELWQNENEIFIISIDPGTVNLCIRVERRPALYDEEANPNEIKTLFFNKYDLNKYFANENNNNDTYVLLIDKLDEWIKEFLPIVHIVIIERQLPKNYKAVRISQCLIDYFIFRLKKSNKYPLIIELQPKVKSKELKAPKHLNDRGIKLWSIDEAMSLLKIRGDQYAIDCIESSPKSKKDDLADTVTQIEAFFSYMGWPVTNRVINGNSATNINKQYLDGYIDEQSLTASTSQPNKPNKIILNVID